MSKRVTPESDYRRFAENLLLKHPEIQDKETYNTAFQKYMKGAEYGKGLKDKAWEHIQGKRKMRTEITPEKARHFPKAAKQIRKGQPEDFRFIGKVKGKTVYSRQIATKAGYRFIDKKGRYASVKKR